MIFNPFEVTLYGCLAVHVLDRLLGDIVINGLKHIGNLKGLIG